NVKGLELKNMTGIDSIGSEDTQMNFTPSLWNLKSNVDFTYYYPELVNFKNSPVSKVREDSLASITNRDFLGSGTLADPFIINNGYDMKKIGEYVAYGDISGTANMFTGKYFKV